MVTALMKSDELSCMIYIQFSSHPVFFFVRLQVAKRINLSRCGSQPRSRFMISRKVDPLQSIHVEAEKQKCRKKHWILLEVVTSIVMADCDRLRLRFQENPTSVGSCPVCEVGKLQQDLAAWGIHGDADDPFSI
jgi:hypothetical protein